VVPPELSVGGALRDNSDTDHTIGRWRNRERGRLRVPPESRARLFQAGCEFHQEEDRQLRRADEKQTKAGEAILILQKGLAEARQIPLSRVSRPQNNALGSPTSVFLYG